MSEAHEVLGAIADVADANTTDEGLDIVNVWVTLIEQLKQNPEMNIESWEVFRQSINNNVAIANNLIDEEIARLKSI